ncbi:MAG TPA: class I SAM-dependent methyltransferase [Longimicrobiales bacterium]
MKLYGELSEWWPLLSAPADYVEEAGFYAAQLLQATTRKPASLLELGCGGGNNAVHMKAHFSEVVLTDVSEGMIGISSALNPDCEHVAADMRTLRLGREFDCVFVHDAVVYMTSDEDLRSAIETAYVHCRPGGAALFAPDHTTETFEPSTDCGGHDGEGRALRYLEWTWDPDPTDTTYVVDYTYVLRDREGTVRTESDRHLEGLFSRAVWLDLLGEAGFVPRVVRFDHSELEPGRYHVFVAVKPEHP